MCEYQQLGIIFIFPHLTKPHFTFDQIPIKVSKMKKNPKYEL